MNIAIIKYNAGNIRSVQFALNRLGYEGIITDDPQVIQKANKVIFPGVGEASNTMEYLKSRGLDQLIRNLQQPVLGICLGQQLLCRYSAEGNVSCIGVFDAEVKRFPEGQKIPHIGWNQLEAVKPPLFGSEFEGAYVYFVHSYYVSMTHETIAACSYQVPFSAAMQKDNFFATQFHPEKSGKAGERILKNFLAL